MHFIFCKYFLVIYVLELVFIVYLLFGLNVT